MASDSGLLSLLVQLSAGFNTVNHSTKIAAFKSYLFDTIQFVHVNGESSSYTTVVVVLVVHGVPQGSAFVPIPFTQHMLLLDMVIRQHKLSLLCR